MWPGAFQLSIWFKFEKRNSESHTRVRVNAIVFGYVNCVNYRMYWIVHTTATLSKLYTKPMLQRVFNQRGGKMLQLLGRVLSTSIHATSHQCQWRRNWVGARVDDTLFSYLSFRHTRTVCTFSQHAQCVMSITEHFNYNNCDCPPECDTISELSNNRIERLSARTLLINFTQCICLTSVSRFDSVQYGQYHDTSMLKNEVMMTSLMINLDSHADFFNEIPEYSEYMVRYRWKNWQTWNVQLFSDIGGAAGLILGMSFSTIVSILDWFISMLATFAQKQLVKCCTKV